MAGCPGSSMLYLTFGKLDRVTLEGCGNDPEAYANKFIGVLRELETLSEKLHLDEDWKIYKFHSGLGPRYSSYVQHYHENHDAFDPAGNAKFDLDYAITRFTTRMPMPLTVTTTAEATALAALTNGTFGHTPRSVLALLVEGLPSDLKIRDPNQFGIQAGAHAGNSRTYCITLKHCTYCKMDRHDDVECLKLRPKRGMDWHDDSECVQLRPKRRNRRNRRNRQ